MKKTASKLWKHIIVDDFLDKEDYNILRNHKKSHVAPDNIQLHHNEIFPDGKVISGSLPEDLIRKLQSKYHEKSLEILRQLAPKKLDLYDYSEFEVVVTGADYKFPIHDDVPKKLLSCVVYLAPEKNSGTMLYSSKYGDDAHEVEWRQNRALFFSRKEATTWHSYRGDGKNNRLALIYNLMTNDIKGVYKAEGTSYFKHQLRKIIKKYSLSTILRKSKMRLKNKRTEPTAM